MYNLVQSFLIEINTFMFSHFTDGKTGTETVSTVLEVPASKRDEEASAGRGPPHRWEPVPAPGPRIRQGAPALARRRRPASGLSFKEQETQLRASERLPRGREAPADAKGPKHEAGEHVPRPFPAQVRFGLFWGQQTVRSRPVLEWCLCGQRAPRSSVRNRRRSTR